jgi:hypothetical protein
MKATIKFKKAGWFCEAVSARYEAIETVLFYVNNRI